MKIKKFTQKDRYGNTVSFDFELPEKPLDPNQVISKMMDMASNGVPPMMGDMIPTADPMTHPGEPMGTDTVPAWLTPGEFVVNKEAMDDPQNAAMVEAINDEGRMMQAAKGGMVPPIQMTGPIPMGYEQGGMIHPDQHEYNQEHAHHMIDPQHMFLGGLIDFFQDPTTPQKLGEAVPKIADTAQSVLPYIGFDTIDESNLDGYAPYGWNIQENRPYTKEEGIAAGTVAPDVPAPQSVPAGVPTPITSPELQQAEVWERQYAGRDPDDLGTAPTGDGSVPPVEATPPAVETDPLTEKAIENLTTGRGLIGALIPPTEIQISEERERLAQAGRARAAGELPDDLVETSANLQAEADELALAASQIPPDTREYDDAVQRAANAQEKADNALEGEARIEAAAAEQTKDEGGKVSDEETKSIVSKYLASQSNNEADTGPDTNQSGENNNTNTVIETGEGGSDGQKSAAAEAIKGAFGDLFDGKELARMAIMYLGSRMMGYSHNGSLRFAGQNYIKRVDAKENALNKFATDNVGKFTAESLQKYKETGDLSALVSVAEPATLTGQDEVYYDPDSGRSFTVLQYKRGDNTYLSADGGSSIFDPSKYHKGTKDQYDSAFNSYSKTIADDLKEMQGRWGTFKDKEGATQYSTDIVSGTEGRKIAEWANKNGVDQARIGGLMQQAYRDAVNEAQASGGKTRPSTLVPYLNSLIIREKTGTPGLFVTNPDAVVKGAQPVFVAGEHMAAANKSILSLSGLSTDLNDKRNIDKLNNFWTYAQSQWDNLDDDVRKQYNRQAKGTNVTGFYKYVQNQLAQYANQQ